MLGMVDQYCPGCGSKLVDIGLNESGTHMMECVSNKDNYHRRHYVKEDKDG